MQPAAGLAKVSEGKASGLDYWNDVDQLIQPADLKASLTRVGAQSAWEEAGKAYRRNLLRWIAGNRLRALNASKRSSRPLNRVKSSPICNSDVLNGAGQRGRSDALHSTGHRHIQ